MNLIPEAPGKTPNYWCTWGTQNVGIDMIQNDIRADVQVQAGNQGAGSPVQDCLNEAVLFKSPGWAKNLFENIRSDLYFMIDQGWDVPFNTDDSKDVWRYGSLEVLSERFPSITGTPAERLSKLNKKIKAEGWRGLGLWVAPQVTGDGLNSVISDYSSAEGYWRERAKWSHAAGIEYWKVDWGVKGHDVKYREMLTRVAKEEAPGLWVEQGLICAPLNDDPNFQEDNCNKVGEGRFVTWHDVYKRAMDLLKFSDILRSYDVTAHLSVVTTLDRVSEFLLNGKAAPDSAGLINCEDELYLGAALGCTFGILRSSLWREIEGKNYDPAHAKKRMDEVVRAVRWQRIAPAFGIGEGKTAVCDKNLTDKWLFKEGDTWAHWVIGKESIQSAPAVIARNIELPVVTSSFDVPFVAAAHNPNGAVSVAALPRTSTEKGIYTPLADVSVTISSNVTVIGIFGQFNNLTFNMSEPLGSKSIWAQDLAGNEAFDITSGIIENGSSIMLPGDLIREIGLSAQTPGDLSEPGMIMVIK